MNRRRFIKSGLLWLPVALAGRAAAHVYRQPAFHAGAFGKSAVGGGGGGPCDTQQDSQTGTVNNWAPNSSYPWIGFNFTMDEAAGDYTLCKMTLRMRRTGTVSGNITLSIYTNDTGEPGTLMSTSDAIAASSVPTTEGDVVFTNLSAALVLTNVHYWGVLKTTVGDGLNFVETPYVFTGAGTSLVKLSDNDGATWDLWTDSNEVKFITYSQ